MLTAGLPKCTWVLSMTVFQLTVCCLNPSPLQGCKERLDPFVPDPRGWSAVRIEDYGYTRMQILNRTHIWLEQVSDDQVAAGARRTCCSVSTQRIGLHALKSPLRSQRFCRVLSGWSPSSILGGSWLLCDARFRNCFKTSPKPLFCSVAASLGTDCGHKLQLSVFAFQDGKVVDRIWLIKDQRGPKTWRP